jgi:hypothetical protein
MFTPPDGRVANSAAKSTVTAATITKQLHPDKNIAPSARGLLRQATNPLHISVTLPN